MGSHPINMALYPPSLAHTVGNVTFKVVHDLKNMFGPKFFKYVHIDTRMAFTDFAINTNKEFIKRVRPILSVRPVVDITNDDIAFTHSMLTTNIYGASFERLGGGNFNFLPFFFDRKHGNSVNYLMSRIRVSFGVMIDVETVVEQMNLFATLNTFFIQEYPYRWETAIEIQIPRQILRMISVDSGIPIYDDKGSVNKFLRFMNMNSGKPVTYQMKNSTGHDEFFLYYPLNIEKIYTDFSMESVNKVGHAVHSSPITFTLTTEFNTIQLFEYSPPRGLPLIIDRYDLDIEAVNFKDGSVMVPICTFDNMFEEYNENGWKFFTTRMYKVDHEKGQTEDRLDLTEILENTSIKNVIDYHNQLGMDNHIFFDIKVMALDSVLKEGRDYEFDFNTLTLITKKLNKNITYRFTIYINNAYLNDLLVKMRPELV